MLIPTHGLIAHVPLAQNVSPTELRHWLVLRLATGIPAVMLLGLLLSLLLIRGSEHLPWLIGGWLSVAGLLVIGGLWYAADAHPTSPSPDDRHVLGPADLARFEAHWEAVTEKAHFIPTGVFVQSLEFQSANNITVAGLAWQRLPLSDDQSCASVLAVPPEEPGFIFPEADPGEELEISLAYHRCDPDYGEEIQGWRFRALLRQDFDYLLYPFDPQEAWLRMLPQDFDKNVILVPDLKAYTRTARAALPGLDQELILPGWERPRCSSW